MVRNWASGCCITNRSGSLHAAIPESSGPCLSLLTCILHGHRHLGWRSSPCMPVVQKDTGLSEFLNPGCQDGNFAAFSIFQPPIAQPFGMADFQNLWFYTYGILRLQASQLDGRHFRRPTMIRPMRWQLQRAVSANACRRSCRNTRSSIWSQNFAPKLSKHFQAFSKHFQVVEAKQVLTCTCPLLRWPSTWCKQETKSRLNHVSMETQSSWLFCFAIFYYTYDSYDSYGTSYFYWKVI